MQACDGVRLHLSNFGFPSIADIFCFLRISSIMVNHITLNLKRAASEQKVITWGIATFEDHRGSSEQSDTTPEASYLRDDIELGRIVR